MKSLYVAWFGVMLLGGLLFFERLEWQSEKGKFESEIARLKMESTIGRQRDLLNQEFIGDLQWSVTNARTYDDGFHDAIMYGASSKGYVDGYHKAIGQNQEQIQHLQALLHSREQDREDKQVVEQSQP